MSSQKERNIRDTHEKGKWNQQFKNTHSPAAEEPADEAAACCCWSNNILRVWRLVAIRLAQIAFSEAGAEFRLATYSLISVFNCLISSSKLAIFSNSRVVYECWRSFPRRKESSSKMFQMRKQALQTKVEFWVRQFVENEMTRASEKWVRPEIVSPLVAIRQVLCSGFIVDVWIWVSLDCFARFIHQLSVYMCACYTFNI